MRSRTAAVLLVAGLLVGCSADSSTPEVFDEQTCGIFRDIAAEATIDTPARVQERLRDLYGGYGKESSPDVAGALRAMLEDMNYGTVDQFTQDVADMSSACSAKGY